MHCPKYSANVSTILCRRLITKSGGTMDEKDRRREKIKIKKKDKDRYAVAYIYMESEREGEISCGILS